MAGALVCLILALAWHGGPSAPAGTVASSEPVRFIPPDMTCKAARAVLDAEPPSKGQIRAVAEGIDQIFAALDDERTASGRARVYARMSEDERRTAMAWAASRCGEHPQETLHRAVEVIYAGLAAVARVTGAND